MDRPDLNPLVVFFFYFLRCLVPLAIMLGISYLLRKFGFIKDPPRPPADWDNGDQASGSNGGHTHA